MLAVLLNNSWILVLKKRYEFFAGVFSKFCSVFFFFTPVFFFSFIRFFFVMSRMLCIKRSKAFCCRGIHLPIPVPLWWLKTEGDTSRSEGFCLNLLCGTFCISHCPRVQSPSQISPPCLFVICTVKRLLLIFTPFLSLFCFAFPYIGRLSSLRPKKVYSTFKKKK